MFRRLALISFLILVPSASLFAASVSVEDNFFSQADITITVGTTVTWTNNGNNVHTVTSGVAGAPSGLFDSGNRAPGQTFSFQFNNTGTFPYFCKIHGSMMRGSVTVTCPNKAQLLKNPGFEQGNVTWVASAASIINNNSTFPSHQGSWKAQLNGKGSSNTQSVYQQITIPSNSCTAKLNFFLRVSTTETGSIANDKLKVQILNDSGAVLKTLKTFSNLNKSSGYVKRTLDVISFKGKTVRVRFQGSENSSLKTTFLLDDVTLNITR